VGEISNRQVYDLAVDILRDVARLETSVDELLLEMRIINRKISSDLKSLSQFSQRALKAPSK
jgi:hypothetical protein